MIETTEPPPANVTAQETFTTGAMSDTQKEAAEGSVDHLNVKVTDGNNEVFFKIKKTTQLKKLMDAFCDRSGKNSQSVRFLFDGQRVNPTDSPETVSHSIPITPLLAITSDSAFALQLEMVDGDTLEVHQEQIGGGEF